MNEDAANIGPGPLPHSLASVRLPATAVLVAWVLVLGGAGEGRLGAQSLPASRVAPARVGQRDGVPAFLHDHSAMGRVTQLVLNARPLATFGGPEGAPNFDLTSVVNVALLDGGGIAAASRSAGVMIFDRYGKGIRVIGRRGTGPGEFSNARMTKLKGDTLLLIDLGTQRLTRLSPIHGLIGSESLVERLPAPTGRPIGQLPTGALLLASAGSWSVLPEKKLRGQSNASIVLIRSGAKGTLLGQIANVELVTVETRSAGIKKPLVDQVRFGLRLQLALWDTLLVTSDGASYRVDLRNSAGKVVSVLEVAAPRAATTAAQRNAGRALELSAFESYSKHTQIPTEARRLIRDAPYAQQLPAISRLFVGDDATLWVVDGLTQFDTTWAATGFRTDGAMIGRLTGTGGVPVAFGEGVVLVKAVDEDGIVRLELRSIVPR